MESVTFFDQIDWVFAFSDKVFHDFDSWEVVVLDVEVLINVTLVDYLLVHFGKVFGSFGGKLPDCFVGV